MVSDSFHCIVQPYEMLREKTLCFFAVLLAEVL